LRTSFLAPVLGDFRARQVSVFTAVVIIFTITWLTMRWMRAALTSNGSSRPWFIIGAIWVVLTLIFEFALGLSLGMSWARMLEDYDVTNGGLMCFGIAAMFVTPWVADRYRTNAAG
jgi:hypothetical protein